MKKKINIISTFLIKNFLLKQYLLLHEKKLETEGKIFLKNEIKIKDLRDQFLALRVNLKIEDKEMEKKIKEMSHWVDLSEDELIKKIDEYYTLIYEYNHKLIKK